MQRILFALFTLMCYTDRQKGRCVLLIDLHLHLDGSLSPEAIWELAVRAGVRLPCQDVDALRPLLVAEQDCENLGEYLEKFDLPLQVLQTEETLSLAVYLLLKQLSKDGLVYAEIRFAPQLHLSRGLTQRQVVTAAVKGLARGIEEFGLPAQLILCCMRSDDNRSANLETVRVAKEFLRKGVCAVDLAGNEAAFPTESFGDIFALAAQLDVPVIIHAGEAAGPESVYQALSLGARRIGHGIRSARDTDLLKVLVQKQIPLETCFTSNLQTKAVASEKEYPIKYLLEQGIPVTVNTDNMTVSGTSLRKEYLLLQEKLGLSDDALLTLACNAAAAAFLPLDKTAALKAQIKKDFYLWLNGRT